MRAGTHFNTARFEAFLSFSICLLFAGLAPAQTPLLYGTSSVTQNNNTVQRVNANGSGNNLLFTASGAGGNGVRRCTAVAVDPSNGKIFLLDVGSNALWSVNLDGSGLALVRSGLTSAPLAVALDILNQKIYYSTSSTVQNGNTIERMDYSGANNTVVFTATGASPGNGVQRCTALAVDTLNSKIFIADAGANSIWSINLAGTGLATVKSGLGAAPMDLALDVTNQLVYFTTSSTTPSLNTIQRVAYNGTGSTTLLVASNGIRRCTSLDLDLSGAQVYFSDAGSNALWSVSTAGGAPALVKNGLSAATVRKVRLVPSVSLITVVNVNDSGPGSLRQALTDISSPGVINFSSTLFSNGTAVISLSAIGDPTYGSSALRVDTQVAIIGPTGTNSLIITRSNSAPAMRLFYVSPTGNLTLKNVSLTNGFALGGIGGSGFQRGGCGGGAGGLGGAVLNDGVLDLEDSTFAANVAKGGDGGGGSSTSAGGEGSGGGGGGLIGPGGSGGQGSTGGTGGPPDGGAGGTGTGGGLQGGVGGGGGGGGSGQSGGGSGPGGDGGFGGGGGGGGAYNTVGFGGGAGGPGGGGGFAGGGGGGGGGTPDGAFGVGGFAGGDGASANVGLGNLGNGGGGGGGLGGAIFNHAGTLTITNCTFSANSAIGGAAGDLSGPASPGLGLGGGIFNRNGTITVLNATFANNTADQGGGIYNLGDGTNFLGNVSLRNTIVGYSPSGVADYAALAINGGGTTNTGSYNLIQANSGFTGGIISSADPRLGPLANNGGPTLTHALLNLSPAIDAGDNSALPATDQRGYPRIADGDGNGSVIVDLGAVEEGLFRLRTIPQTASNIQLLGFQLFLTGESNRLYVTEFSPDLMTWTSFATSEVFGAEVPVTDTQTGAATKRFYRAHVWP